MKNKLVLFLMLLFAGVLSVSFVNAKEVYMVFQDWQDVGDENALFQKVDMDPSLEILNISGTFDATIGDKTAPIDFTLAIFIDFDRDYDWGTYFYDLTIDDAGTIYQGRVIGDNGVASYHYSGYDEYDLLIVSQDVKVWNIAESGEVLGKIDGSLVLWVLIKNAGGVYSAESGFIEFYGTMEEKETCCNEAEQRISTLEQWKAAMEENNESCCTELGQRISTLETFAQNINQTITAIQDSLASMLSILTGHTTSIGDQGERITTLENKEYPAVNMTRPYFKYLGSSDRKSMVCGYAIDNHLDHVEDLGYSCNITYRFVGGKEKASCRCVKI